MTPSNVARPLNAPALFALSQQAKCEGPEQCFWCGNACHRMWTHGQPTNPIIGVPRNPHRALWPASLYVCTGCYLFTRPSVTVVNLSGSYFKDRQSPVNHSWWITLKGAWSLRRDLDRSQILELLLQPPRQFVLSLVEDKITNYIHQGYANDVNTELAADLPLGYSLNGIRMDYTIYDLTEALKHKGAVRTPGVRALFRFFGDFEGVDLTNVLGFDPAEERKSRGSDAITKGLKKEVCSSGR